VGISAGIMQLFSSFRILAWLTPLCCLWVLACEAAPATSAEVRSELVRQTVLDILSYTRWPSEPARLRLCVAAPTEYAASLLTIRQQANGRPVDVHRYEVDGGYAILSISEQSSECIADAVFCLQARKERVRFRVNLDALARSGVRVHPAVLKLARADEEAR